MAAAQAVPSIAHSAPNAAAAGLSCTRMDTARGVVNKALGADGCNPFSARIPSRWKERGNYIMDNKQKRILLLSMRQKRILPMAIWAVASVLFVYLCILTPLVVGAQSEPTPDCDNLGCILPDPVAITATPTLSPVAPTSEVTPAGELTPFEPTSTLQPTPTNTRRPTFTPTPVVISPLPRQLVWLPMVKK